MKTWPAPAVLALVSALQWAALSPPWLEDGSACCNVVPDPTESFLSHLGTVNRRLVEPGGWVRVTLDPACLGSGGGFDTASPTNNKVRVTFESAPPRPDGTPWGTAAVDVDASKVSAPNSLTLQFEMPDTTGNDHPNGLAGPARIRVTTPRGQLRAEIADLYLPSGGCVGTVPEGVFLRFTVLPRPNDFAAEVDRDRRLLMTVDGGGNVLIPLDHSGTLASRGPALETGYGKFRPFEPAIGSPYAEIREALAAALKTNPTRKLVSAFTFEGHPLDPDVVWVETTGALAGRVDQPRSVVRISRLDQDGQPIYDLSHRLTLDGPEAGTGPMVIENTRLLWVVYRREFKLWFPG